MTLDQWLNVVGMVVLSLTALFTWRAAKASANAAKASESFLFVELAPIVDVVSTGFTSGGSRAPFVDVAFQNIGRGPALNGHVDVQVTDVDRLEPMTAFAILASGAKDNVRGTVNHDYVQAVQGTTEITTRVRYSDVAGNRYQVTKWVRSQNGLAQDERMSIDRVLPDGSIVSILRG